MLESGSTALFELISPPDRMVFLVPCCIDRCKVILRRQLTPSHRCLRVIEQLEAGGVDYSTESSFERPLEPDPGYTGVGKRY